MNRGRTTTNGGCQLNAYLKALFVGGCLVFLLVGCGDSRGGGNDAVGVESAEEDASPTEINFYVPEEVNPSCPGIKENPNFPAEYKLVCEEVFAQNPELDQGSSCVHLPDNPEVPCYCKICAIKGIEKICIKEICN